MTWFVAKNTSSKAVIFIIILFISVILFYFVQYRLHIIHDNGSQLL